MIGTSGSPIIGSQSYRVQAIARMPKLPKPPKLNPKIFADQCYLCLSVVMFCFSDLPMTRCPDDPIRLPPCYNLVQHPLRASVKTR